LLLAAPGYFGRTLSLGGLMMVVGAFYQVQQALRWYVDRFPAIAEWRAMLTRVIEYRSALAHLGTLGAEVGLIQYDTDPSGIFSIEDLCVFAPNGRISLSEQHVKIMPGERVLIAATPKSGKTIFLKALAGLWMWGSGTIRLPSGQRIMFVPQAVYVPAGTLRAALAYPDAAGGYSDLDIRRALDRVQLGQFSFALDAVKRWDKELTLGEQRRLILGRMLLLRPQWVIQDETISELDEESRKLALSIFALELAHTAVVSIGRYDPSLKFYQRTLSLQSRLPGLRLPIQFQSEAPVQARAEVAT
jgi:putative ATP-binding cassette transporter